MQPQASRDAYRRVLISRSTAANTEAIEERGDLTRFYNLVFLARVETFLQRFTPPSVTSGTAATTTSAASDPAGKTQPPLTPLPAAHSTSATATATNTAAAAAIHSHSTLQAVHGSYPGLPNEGFLPSR